jgi:hypothetical protein
MTVQEIIDRLSLVKDKSKQVWIGINGGTADTTSIGIADDESEIWIGGEFQ